MFRSLEPSTCYLSWIAGPRYPQLRCGSVTAPSQGDAGRGRASGRHASARRDQAYKTAARLIFFDLLAVGHAMAGARGETKLSCIRMDTPSSEAI